MRDNAFVGPLARGRVMKLYNQFLSPFAARCRIQIYAKQLPIEIVEPPGGTRSEAYRRLNPIARVPALELDGGVLPESQVICEYLEDRFPRPSLRPSDPLECARMRLAARIVDVYLNPPFVVLSDQLDPTKRDSALVAQKLDDFQAALDHLEHFLDPAPFAAGGQFSLADCALAPFFFFATRVGPVFGLKDLFETRPSLGRWWLEVQTHPAVARAFQELEQALAAWLAGEN
jgi:glutathione S-transferase